MPVTYYMQGIILFTYSEGDIWLAVYLLAILCAIALRTPRLSRAL